MLSSSSSKRLTLALAMVALTGAGACGALQGEASNGADAGADGDGRAEPKCETALVGTAPFGVVLRGRATVVANSYGAAHDAASANVDVTVAAYLREGRVAGAPIVVAHANTWPHGGIFTGEATIDERGGTPVFRVEGFDERRRILGLNLALSPTGGPLFGEVDWDLDDRGDVEMAATGSITLCPTDEPLPVARATVAPGIIAPTSPWFFVPEVPLGCARADQRARA
jgi:hypothetical protein